MAKKTKKTRSIKDEDFELIGPLGHSIDFGFDNRIMSHKVPDSLLPKMERTLKRAQTMIKKQQEKQKEKQSEKQETQK